MNEEIKKTKAIELSDEETEKAAGGVIDTRPAHEVILECPLCNKRTNYFVHDDALYTIDCMFCHEYFMVRNQIPEKLPPFNLRRI